MLTFVGECQHVLFWDYRSLRGHLNPSRLPNGICVNLPVIFSEPNAGVQTPFDLMSMNRLGPII